jgi:hypothetical protein
LQQGIHDSPARSNLFLVGRFVQASYTLKLVYALQNYISTTYETGEQHKS